MTYRESKDRLDSFTDDELDRDVLIVDSYEFYEKADFIETNDEDLYFVEQDGDVLLITEEEALSENIEIDKDNVHIRKNDHALICRNY